MKSDTGALLYININRETLSLALRKNKKKTFPVLHFYCDVRDQTFQKVYFWLHIYEVVSFSSSKKENRLIFR